MRDLKFVIGLLAFVVFSGGCIMEPLDPESEEGTTDSIEEGVSTAPPSVPQDDDEETESTRANPLRDSMRSGKSNVGGVGSPAKPQPDPWEEIVRDTDDSVTVP